MPVILVHGDNHVEIDETVRAARQPFDDASVLTFDGATVPLPALAEATLTMGLFDPERLVLVHDLHDRYKAGKKETPEVEELRGILRSVVDTTTLLLVSRDLGGDHPLVADVRAAGGTVRPHTVPKRAELPRWIAARARASGAPITRPAADLLAELIGSNPLMLQSEIEKLATYAGSDGIDETMVAELVGVVTQESIFTLVDAIAAGDGARALELMRQQMEAASGPIEFALYLIRMLARQVRILLGIKLGQDAGRSPKEIAVEVRIPPYYADRYFRQARRFSLGRLAGSFERLAALEADLKSGRVDAPTGLDVLVTELCR